jgi:hypothetical protein
MAESLWKLRKEGFHYTHTSHALKRSKILGEFQLGNFRDNSGDLRVDGRR